MLLTPQPNEARRMEQALAPALLHGSPLPLQPAERRTVDAGEHTVREGIGLCVLGGRGCRAGRQERRTRLAGAKRGAAAVCAVQQGVPCRRHRVSRSNSNRSASASPAQRPESQLLILFSVTAAFGARSACPA